MARQSQQAETLSSRRELEEAAVPGVTAPPKEHCSTWVGNIPSSQTIAQFNDRGEPRPPSRALASEVDRKTDNTVSSSLTVAGILVQSHNSVIPTNQSHFAGTLLRRPDIHTQTESDGNRNPPPRPQRSDSDESDSLLPGLCRRKPDVTHRLNRVSRQNGPYLCLKSMSSSPYTMRFWIG
jgi:hypothetical protein